MLSIDGTTSDAHKHDFSKTVSDATFGSTTSESCPSPVSTCSSSDDESADDSVQQELSNPSLSALQTLGAVSSLYSPTSTWRHSPVSTESTDVKILTLMLTREENDPTWVAQWSGTSSNFQNQQAHWHCLSHSALRHQVQMEIEALLLRSAYARGEVIFSATANPSMAGNVDGDGTTTELCKDYLDSVAAMCAVIENRLYHCASSLQKYSDSTTLPSRLLVLVKTLLSEFKAEECDIETVHDMNVPPSRICAMRRRNHVDNTQASSSSQHSSVASPSVHGGSTSSVKAAEARESELDLAKVQSTLDSPTVSSVTTSVAASAAAPESGELNKMTGDSSITTVDPPRVTVVTTSSDGDGMDATDAAVTTSTITTADKELGRVTFVTYTVPPTEASSTATATATAAAATTTATVTAVTKPAEVSTAENSRTRRSTVSSQGCSRLFIVKVLFAVSEYVRGRQMPSIFTFSKEMVNKWLQDAWESCRQVLPQLSWAERLSRCGTPGGSSSTTAPTVPSDSSRTVPPGSIIDRMNNNYNEDYGGAPFIADDSSTHWTESSQLYTWWKNNVERRTKFKLIQFDSLYEGVDVRRQLRAVWCSDVVKLSEIIRASCGHATSLTSAQFQLALRAVAPIAGAVGGSVDPSHPTYVPTKLAPAVSPASACSSRSNSSEGDTSSPVKAQPGPEMDICSSTSAPLSVDIPSAADHTRIHGVSPNNNNSNSDVDVDGDDVGSVQKRNYDQVPLRVEEADSTVMKRFKSGLSVDTNAAGDAASGSTGTPMSGYSSVGADPSQYFSPNREPVYATSSSSCRNSANSVIGGLGTMVDEHSDIYGQYLRFPHKLFDMLSIENVRAAAGDNDIVAADLAAAISSSNHPLHPSHTEHTKNLIVRWLPSCNGFQVLDMEQFVGTVLPRHFKHSNFTSFQRQLNLYGFKRLRFGATGNVDSMLLSGVVLNSDSTGGYRGTYIYSHPLFVFNKRDMCDNIRRVPVTPSHKRSNSVIGSGSDSGRRKPGSVMGEDLKGLSTDADVDGNEIYSVLLAMKESVPTTITTTAGSTTTAGVTSVDYQSDSANIPTGVAISTTDDTVAGSDYATAAAVLGLKAISLQLTTGPDASAEASIDQ